MKVLLYQQNEKRLKTSGIGRALKHQEMALKNNGIEVTFNPHDTFDLAHINTLFETSQIFLRKCQKEHIPTVVHGHSTIEDFRDSFRLWKVIARWFNKQLLKMYRAADIIVTPTEYSKKLISSYEGVNCPVYNISNGIILEDYARNEKNIKSFEEHFKITKDQKVVIGVGLLFRRKGLDDFIEVARRFPDVTFIWFGALQKFATTHYILKTIRKRPKNVIMAGYIAGDIIKGAFSRANLMFFPSREETEGIVVLEALAAKTPLLIRDIGVYSPWLKNQENCLMGKSIPEFVEQIEYALSHDLSSLTEKGYQTVEERNIEAIGHQLVDLYQEAIRINQEKNR